MSDEATDQARLRVAELSNRRANRFRRAPDEDTTRALAETLGAEALRKLALTGEVKPVSNGWRLEAHLGATAVQNCVVTLEPVSTRIERDVVRTYLPAQQLDSPEPGSETEVPEDDSVEPLGEVIDLDAVMLEALALALPDYPRKEGVEIGQALYAEDGVVPMTDEDARPFAGLKELRDKLGGSDGES